MATTYENPSAHEHDGHDTHRLISNPEALWCRDCQTHYGETADGMRGAMLANAEPAADLAAEPGPTWDTAELQRDYTVEGFAAPFVVVRRKADGVRGSLEFQHSPRVYFNFVPDDRDGGAA